MSDNSKIEWTDATFNPWIGCTKVGPGCDNCYAAAQDNHRKWTREGWGSGRPRKRTSPSNWNKPRAWNRKAFYECQGCGWRGDDPCTASPSGLTEGMPSCPECDRLDLLDARRRVFCASLADVFDNEVPQEWREDLWALIEATPNLDWLLLTKRIGNVLPMIPMYWRGDLPPNVWLGATIVNQPEADRDIPKLLNVPARIRFLSMEPLLGPVDLMNLRLPSDGRIAPDGGWREVAFGKHMAPNIDWVIVGGESGPRARPMHPDWARSLRDQCQAAGVPFFFKQHGEWLAAEFATDEQADLRGEIAYVNREGEVHNGADGVDFFGGDEQIARVGKKHAGRQIDGRTWDEVPA